MFYSPDNPFQAPSVRGSLVRVHPIFKERQENLPRGVGGCAWGAVALADILQSHGFESEIVIGTFKRGRWQSDHCWTRSQGWILDWAVEQFRVNTPWLLTVIEDPRFQMVRPDGSPAISIAVEPGAEITQKLEQVFQHWPEDQRPYGEEFDEFRQRARSASMTPASPPSMSFR